MAGNWQERPAKPQTAPLDPERVEDVRKMFNLEPVAFRIICVRKCEGFNKEELIEFLYVCKSLKLDPAMGQVHGIVRWSWDDNAWKKSISIQISIEGLRALAEMNEDYAGNDEPVFHWQVEGTSEVKSGPVFPSGSECLAVTCAVYRYGRNQEKLRFAYTAYLRDYAQRYSGKLTSMWEKTGIMLPKCSEAGALRKGWPQVMKNLYITEEMLKALEDDQAPRPAAAAAASAEPQKSESFHHDPEPATASGQKPQEAEPRPAQEPAKQEAERKAPSTQRMAEDIVAALRDRYKEDAGKKLKEYVARSSNKDKYDDVSKEIKGAVIKILHSMLSTNGPTALLQTLEDFFNPKPKEKEDEGRANEQGAGTEGREPGDDTEQPGEPAAAGVEKAPF